MEKQIINELFAFVAEEEPGSEGVTGMTINMPGSGPTFAPLIGADMARVESLKQRAIDIGVATNKKITLKTFKLVSEEIIFDPLSVSNLPSTKQ